MPPTPPPRPSAKPPPPMMQSPAAPPIKKQRSSQTPPSTNDDLLSLEADTAIAKRRAELRRLQQQMQASTASYPGTSTAGSTSSLLSRAQASLSGAPPPMAVRRGQQASALLSEQPPPDMPKPAYGFDRVRHSDIFPSVVSKAERKAAPPPPPPPPPAAVTGSSHVARRLDFVGPRGASTRPPPPPPPPPAGKSRSRSAPPVRPPPPPPPKDPPPAAAKNRATPATSLPPPSEDRGRQTRPAPIVPGAAPTPLPVEKKVAPVAPPMVPPSPRMAPVNAAPQPVDILKGDSAHSVTSNASTEVSSNTGHKETPPENTWHKEVVFEPNVEYVPTATTTPTTTAAGYATQHAGMTPFAAGVGGGGGGGAALHRRTDLLQNMRNSADTPPVAAPASRSSWPPILDDESIDGIPPASPELRIQKALVQAEQDKRAALQKIAQLERELQEKATAGSGGGHGMEQSILSAVLHMASAQGERAALSYARQQLDALSSPEFASNRNVGFLSPVATFMGMTGLAGAEEEVSSPARRRYQTTPFPKRHASEDDDVYVQKAVACAHHIYVTPHATFTIRRPCGLATERDLWLAAGQLPNKVYEQAANVYKVATLEVVAHVHADESMLALSGDCTVQRQDAQGDWQDHGNLDERDGPLGRILYIDKDANEQEYSLDELYEQLDGVRYNYTLTVIQMADGLRMHEAKLAKEQVNAPPPPPPPPALSTTMAASPAPVKPPTTDSSVQTDAIEHESQAAPQNAPPPSTNKASPPADEGSDVMSVFMGMLLNGIGSTAYMLLIGLPLRILTTTIVFLMAGVLVSLLWLFLEDDHGARAMGAHYNFYTNPPGIL